MIVETLVVGLLQTNCYLIEDEETGETAVIDPGGHAARIVEAIGKLGTQACVRYVINTHAHFDHVLDNKALMRRLNDLQETSPELVAHAQAAPQLAAGGGARWFGFVPVPSPDPDRLVEEGDLLPLGQLSLQVLHTPGHSPGSISLYHAETKALFAGDVLFRQGVGRWDLPGGDWATLLDSIRNRLFAFPDDTIVYPGHGPPTTIGQEKRDNPYIRA